MRPRLDQLRADVRARAENRPGVYRMRGPSGEVLYVGKSVRVRTRLLSYFRAQRGEKAAEIIGHAHDVEWEYVPSEFAALLLEFRLIKRWRPLFNVEHKRDSLLCFIKLTREPVPRLLVVGHVINDGAEYFGPLRGRQGVTEAVRAVCDLLELRDCPADTPMRLADQIELFRLRADPRCMRGQVGRCLSPCAGGCTRTEHAAPRTPSEHRALREKVGELFERPEPRTVGLRAHEAQEVLLVARWFRLNPSELERTEFTSKPTHSDLECMENGTPG